MPSVAPAPLDAGLSRAGAGLPPSKAQARLRTPQGATFGVRERTGGYGGNCLAGDSRTRHAGVDNSRR